MFSNASSKRKSISLTHEQIVEDLAALNNSPEHRNKLYLCIDDQIPQNQRFVDLDNMLQDSEKLQELTHTLKERVKSLQSLSNDIIMGIDEIKNKASAP